MRWLEKVVLLAGAIIASGCATQRELTDRSASAGPSPYSFWPPPPSTYLAVSNAGLGQAIRLADVARRVETKLRAAGYPAPHWYPIGLKYRHGFAATTRLEAVNEDANPVLQSERWSPLYPDAATVRWLTLARTMPLPKPGRYRVLLIAVTDLPLGSSALAPIWNEDTVMDGPGFSTGERSPISTDGSSNLSGYRVGVYVYEYERRQGEARGRASDNGTAHSATEQARTASLAELAFVDPR